MAGFLFWLSFFRLTDPQDRLRGAVHQREPGGVLDENMIPTNTPQPRSMGLEIDLALWL
jgi:hypothetical protein